MTVFILYLNKTIMNLLTIRLLSIFALLGTSFAELGFWKDGDGFYHEGAPDGFWKDGDRFYH